MRIIDRYLLRQFLQNFVICFMSLDGVYVVFDAFTNLEAFMNYKKGMALMEVMAVYYGYQSLFFFDRISALLVLMSAMFTTAWIQRHNEMTALMAAGIARIRIVAPVLAAAAVIVALAVVNREIVIPKLKEQLAKRPCDLGGNVIEELLPQYDNATDVLIGGRHAVVDQKRIEAPQFVVPPDRPSLCEYGKQWTAAAAFWQPAKDGRPMGYLLDDVIEPKGLAQRPSLALDGRPVLITPHDHPEWLKPNQAFMVSDVTVDELTGGMVLRQFAFDGGADLDLEEPLRLFQSRRAGHDPRPDPAAALGPDALVPRPAAGGGSRPSQRVRGDWHVRGPGGLVLHCRHRLSAAGRELPDQPRAGRLGTADDLRARRRRHVVGHVGTVVHSCPALTRQFLTVQTQSYRKSNLLAVTHLLPRSPGGRIIYGGAKWN